MKRWFIAIAAVALASFVAYAQSGAPGGSSPTPTRRAPELEQQLRAYEQRVIGRAEADTRPVLALLRQARDAMGDGKSTIAIGILEVLAGKDGGRGEGGARTWLRLALAWEAQAFSRRSQPPAEAMVSAYRAYLLATNDPQRIDALSLLGNMLLQSANAAQTEADQSAPGGAAPAADNREAAKRLAYQIFTELGRLAGDGRFDEQKSSLAAPFKLQQVTYPLPPSGSGEKSSADRDRDRCDALKERLGSGKAASDEAAADGVQILLSRNAECRPNGKSYACLVFTRSLDSNLEDIAHKITIQSIIPPGPATPGLNYPASIEGNTVCYANLRFGTVYRVAVNQSLRAADGATLARPAVASLPMPDYEPSLGFKRGTYVLPANGPGAIELHSVNVRRAKLMVRRIGDRNLIREMVMKNIVGRTDPNEACFILNTLGEEIAEGDATFTSERNETAQYSIPMGTILEQRRKWLESNNQGGEFEFKQENMSFRIIGDQTAAALTPFKQPGVFAIFGRITGEVAASGAPDKQDCSSMASQWFAVTNIGLTLQSSSNWIYVIARRLDTGAALPGVNLDFISRSGALLLSTTTGNDGVARIPARLGRGTGGNTLVGVMAYLGSDFAFLDKTGDMVDLTDRGFEGSGPGGEYDAFVAPARGIYRPGETIEALVLLRGRNGQVIPDLPSFDVQLTRSDGSVVATQSFDRANGDFSRDGGFFVSFPLATGLREGSFNLEVKVLDRKAGSAPIEVRHFQPHTVRLVQNDASWAGAIAADNVLRLSGKPRAEYLYGLATGGLETDAPAANLRGDFEVRIEPTASPLPGCFEDFAFGQNRVGARAQLVRGTALSTDDKGRIGGEAGILLERTGVERTGVPQRAVVKMSLLDLNGKAAEREFPVPLAQPGRRWIGIKSLGAIEDQPGRPTKFELIVLADNNQPVVEPLRVSVFRELSAFVWQQDGSGWDYVTPANAPRESVKPPFAVTTAPQGTGPRGHCPVPSTFTIPFDQTGSYVVEVADDAATTELSVGYGLSTSPDGSLKPDALRVWTQEKGSFAPGDEIQVGIDTPHKAGKAFGEVTARGEILASFEAEIGNNRANASVKVGHDWTGPMHIYVTSFRQAEDDSIQNGPGRAIGGTMIRVSDGGEPAGLQLTSSETMMTGMIGKRPLTVELAATGGLTKNAWVALAAVDEGVLSLTDFKTPDPLDHYFGRKRFDFDVYDTYGRILYGTGRRSGGDEEGLRRPLGTGYTQSDIVVWHSQIQQLSNGRLTLQIPADRIPAKFQGEIRLMAWAWDGRSVAVKQGKVTVRDPIVVEAVPPHVMAPGDTALVPLRVTNIGVEGIDQITVQVHASGAVALVPNPGSRDGVAPCGSRPASECAQVTLPARKSQPPTIAYLRVKASDGDLGSIELSYTLPGMPVGRTWEVPVRAPYPTVARVIARAPIPPGGSFRIGQAEFERAALEGLASSSMRLAVRVARTGIAPATGLDVAETQVRQLDQLAYLLQLRLIADAAPADGTQGRQADAQATALQLAALVGEITALQNPPDGQFLRDGKPRKADEYSTDTMGVGPSALALDVLARARKAGVAVDGKVLDRTVGYLLSALRDMNTCDRSDVYALAVLAKLNLIGGAALRSAGDSCTRTLADDWAGKLMLASAYTTFGFAREAHALLGDARPEDVALGDDPTEAARTAALVLESGTGQPDVQKLVSKIGLTTAGGENLATASWLARAALAASTILGGGEHPFIASDISVTPSGLIERVNADGVSLRHLGRSDVPAAGVQITNQGSVALQANIAIDGVPLKTDGEDFSKFAIAVQKDGVALDPAQPIVVKQFSTVYFTVSINQTDGYRGQQRLAVVQILPTGFEGIDSAYDRSWSKIIGGAVTPSAFSGMDYCEFQDDRWIALPSATPGVQHHLLGFSLRPVMQGEFMLPPLAVRDLNNPDRLAWSRPLRVRVEAPQ